MGEVQKTRNTLIDDPEITKKFYEVALLHAEGLKSRYPSIARLYDPSDVVQEVWCKVLRTRIDFDESRECSFTNFVRMLVEHMFQDLLKKAESKKRCERSIISFNDSGELNGMIVEYSKILKADEKDYVCIEDKLLEEEFFNLLSPIACNIDKRRTTDKHYSVADVIDLRYRGNSFAQMSLMLNADSCKLVSMVRSQRKTFWDLCNDFMGDIVRMPSPTIPKKSERLANSTV